MAAGRLGSALAFVRGWRTRSHFPVGDPEKAALAERRNERVIALAALAGAIGFGTLAFWPDPAPYAAEEFAEIGVLERKAVASFRGILTDAQAKRISDLEAAERVEREVLVPWREARRRLEAARAGWLEPYFPPEMAEYFRLREESWEALVASVRKQDAGLAAKHRELWAAGDRVAATIAGALIRARSRAAAESLW